MPNINTYPTKAAPVAGDKVLGTDSLTNQIAQFALGGMGVANVVTKTAAYTLGATDGIVVADTAGGAWTLTLPAASVCAGRQYIIKRNANGGANALTVQGAQTIDGTASSSIAAAYGVLRLFSDGSLWYTF